MILFCGYALDASGKTYYINLFINIILSIIGTIVGIISKIKIVEGSVLKRYTLSIDVSKIELLIFTLINIGCVIYMIIVGVILFIKKKDYYFFLSGFFMFFFSAIGPLTKNSHLNYLLSTYGEILLVIFLYMFFRKQVRLNIKLKDSKIE